MYELRAEWRSFGNEVRFIDQLLQRRLVAFGSCKVGEFAHVQHTDDMVDVVAVDRQPRMIAGRDDLADLRIFIVEVNADDFVVRDHDVINRHLFEIENADQHLAVAAGNACAGLKDDSAEFLARQ